MNISVFKSLLQSKETPFTQTALEVYYRIKEGYPELIQKIEKIRALDKGHEEYDKTKKSLRAIMFNGTFSERNDNGLIQHSGLCITDYDDYPNLEVMEAERAKLISSPYTYMLFTSPSGNGLKCVIKIPACDKAEHKRRFKAYQQHIDSEYFDPSSANVSRVCFESYDTDAYINIKALEYTDITQDAGFSSFERVPVLSITNDDKIIGLIMKFNFGDFRAGRNNWIFKVASCFCEYGIDVTTAKNYLIQYAEDGFTENEIRIAVGSGYKKALPNSKYFEDNATIDKVKLKIRDGIKPEDIVKQLDVSSEVVADINKEVANSEEVFWKVDKKGICIEPDLYTAFLTKNGFARYYHEGAHKSTLVRVVENKVSLSSVEKIKDYILDYLKTKKQINVWNYCCKSPYLFTDNHLTMIDSIEFLMLDDTKDISYLPYRNGVVKVSKTNIEIVPYIDIEGYIWDSHIIQRDYTPGSGSRNDFRDFISKICANDVSRIRSLECTIGYLLHTHKDKADQKAIIFNDQEIDDNPNGGSGKSLVLTAIGKIRNIVKIDGKSFNPAKSDFVYQRVNVDSQILAFDDVKKNFDFEQLFSLISEGITVNRKNKDEIFIPFEHSPKIVITTNYVISGAGGSHDRRRHEVEFFQYFNATNSPQDLYKKLFFDEWNEDEWHVFDNYMINNLQQFMKAGLVKTIPINADVKRLIQATCKDFYEFVIDNGLELNTRLYNSTSLEKFKNETGGYKDLDTKRFHKWIKEYCKYKDLKFTTNRDNHGRYFELSKEGAVVPDTTDIWDELTDKASRI